MKDALNENAVTVRYLIEEAIREDAAKAIEILNLMSISHPEVKKSAKNRVIRAYQKLTRKRRSEPITDERIQKDRERLRKITNLL